MVTHRPQHSNTGLKETLDRILDKGVAIDAKLRLALYDLDLIQIRSTLILTSFQGGIKGGMEFPNGINYNAKAWKVLINKEPCPQCNKLSTREELKGGCPWCGFILGGS